MASEEERKEIQSHVPARVRIFTGNVDRHRHGVAGEIRIRSTDLKISIPYTLKRAERCDTGGHEF
jgi:hypothetical protein